MLDLDGKGAHALIVASGNVQALGREVVLVFGHGFGNIHHLLFDGADFAVDHGGEGGRSLRLGRAGCDLSRLTPGGLTPGSHGEGEQRWQDESSFFHECSSKSISSNVFSAGASSERTLRLFP